MKNKVLLLSFKAKLKEFNYEKIVGILLPSTTIYEEEKFSKMISIFLLRKGM